MLASFTSARLDRIVGNLLSVSRVSAGALAPAIEPESLEQLVAVAVDRLQLDDVRQIVVDIPPDLPDVAVDAVQIDQVLTNLLDNALRHGRTDGVVGVQALRLATTVAVTVTDDGPGFGAEMRAHLFEPLARSGDQRAGLGLTVCKAIVDAHGGTISVGDSLGGGACVRFTLPLGEGDDHGGRG